jgi:hypothetical protein
MVAWQAVFSGEEGFTAWVWGPATIASVVPAWWLVGIISAGRTPYDRWALARVGLSPVHENRSEMTDERGAAGDQGHDLGVWG